VSLVKQLQGRPDITAAIAAGAVALVLLSLQLTADPATGVTFSAGPFTDEGFSVLGARNQALLGRWSTDEWQLYLTQLPFSLVVAAVFELFGVGILQARVVSLAASVLAVVLLAGFTGRRLGVLPGIIGGVALATSSLFLYYGRLAMLEPAETVFLVLGFVLLFWQADDARGRGRREAIVLGVGGGAALALAAGTKPVALFVVAPLLLVTAVGSRSRRELRHTLVAALLTLLTAALAWVALILVQPRSLQEITAAWPRETLPSSLQGLLTRARDYLENSDAAIPYAAPLLAGALVGVASAASAWRSLPASERLMIMGATIWFLAGVAFVLAVPYRPNRYVVPLLPPLAVLTAVGAARVLRWSGDRALPVGLVMMILLSAPGGAQLAAWLSTATHRLPMIQEAVLREIASDGGGSAVQGSVTFAMRVPAPVIPVQGAVNDGDLYAQLGVRWLVARPDVPPHWASLHPQAWAHRQVGPCFAWPSGPACVIHVP
jgi:4-amino-4-deoxy-L-arabinose transferase-like glycosyltransferase